MQQNEQTWTDEHLQECLASLNLNAPHTKLTLRSSPYIDPWRGTRHILQYGEEVVTLTLAQAQMVEAWLLQQPRGISGMQQNDQGWPPYKPERPRSLDEITVEEAQYVTNMLLDCQGLEFIRYIDNRVAEHLRQWEKDVVQRLRLRHRGDA